MKDRVTNVRSLFHLYSLGESPYGRKIDVLCGPNDGSGTLYPQLHYAIYTKNFKVELCKRSGASSIPIAPRFVRLVRALKILFHAAIIAHVQYARIITAATETPRGEGAHADRTHVPRVIASAGERFGMGRDYSRPTGSRRRVSSCDNCSLNIGTILV